MSKKTPPPGFVMPPQQPYNPSYPPTSHPQAGYPPQQAGSYQPPPQYAYQPPHNQPFPPPIQQQPGQQYVQQPFAGGWMNANFHSYLQNATSFHVKQKVELVEALLGWEQGNKYTVKDQSGHKIFYVGEESGCCNRQFCSSSRPFTLTVKDTVGQNIIIMDRPMDCSCCCGFFCPDEMNVSTPQGQLLGSIKEEFDFLYPRFAINDATGRKVLEILGPMCPLTLGTCTGNAVFRVMTLAGATVGTISKEWSGLVRELFTDADFFSISFPIDLDPAIKAVCLGALFMIDYEYFEDSGNSNGGGRRLFG